MPDSQEPVITPHRGALKPEGTIKGRQERLLTAGEVFLKKYRTEIAASASSCVSTFVAVSGIAFVLNPLSS